MEPAEHITEHYSFGGLRSRIEAGLASTGGEPTVSMLGAVDEFHVGGRPATAFLVERLGLNADDHVLDVGSGLGGLARYIATHTGAAVTGVDLTKEYVDVAAWLTNQVGLDEQVSFRHGTAADLGALADQFTAATMLHVGMNIADKRAVFAEVASQLAPGAPFAIYDLMVTGDQRPAYPTPWAASSATSFLETPQQYCDHLEAAGFVVGQSIDRTEAAVEGMKQLAATANQGSAGPPPLGLHLVMGEQFGTKVANLGAAIRSGILAPTVIIGKTPS